MAVACTFEIVGGVVSLDVTVTLTPAPGVSTLPLSSVARLFRLTAPAMLAVHEKVQVPRPAAGCQVVPPSVETSTPPTRPPVSDAVPLIVTTVFCGIEAPGAGDV